MVYVLQDQKALHFLNLKKFEILEHYSNLKIELNIFYNNNVIGINIF